MDEKNNLFVSIVLLFIFIICIIGYIYYFRGMFDNDISEEVVEVDDDNIRKDVKKRLSKFINSASVFSESGYSSTAQAFYNGTTTITDDIKYKMAFNSIYKIDKNYKSDVVLTTEEANNMKRVFNGDISNESFDIIKISDFNKAYEELFHEKPNYTLDTIKNISCPSPWGFNSELDRIYLFYKCSGVGYSAYDSDIVSYEFDDNYYYVHQLGTLKSALAKSDFTYYKVLWKFDKKLNFISTTNE